MGDYGAGRRHGVMHGGKWIGLVACLWLFFAQQANATMIGFRVEKGEFSLSVLFGMADQELSTKDDYAEVADTGRLLFETLRWVNAHAEELEAAKVSVMVFWDIPSRSFSIQVEDELVLSNIGYEPGRASTTLRHEVWKALRLPPTKVYLPPAVPIHVVRSTEYLESWQHSDIVAGSMPGYVYAKDSDHYLLLMWQWDPASPLAKRVAAQGATVSLVDFDAAAMRRLLGTIE